MQPGETLMRTRWQWSLTNTTDVPSDWSGITIVQGLILGTSTTTPPPTSPTTNPSSQDWIWWEGAAWDVQYVTRDSGGSVTFVEATAPRDNGVRDSEAARKAFDTGTTALWWRVERATAGFGPEWYPQIASSALVKLAPDLPA